MRDNFSKQTIAEIAKGVGYRCSNPECARPTVAANAAQDGIVVVGVAAHICAASPGGPRYNTAQSPETRRACDNGIWLCQNCGRLIDSDPEKFTVDLLIRWKRDAQARAFRELVGYGDTGPTEEATRIGFLVSTDNRSEATPRSEEIFSKVHVAAGNDLAAFKRGPIWSGGAVELTLRLPDDQAAVPFTISKLPPALEIESEVTIVAGPGTGKTTTLLQLAGHVLAANSIIPLYFRLGDWSASSSTLLASLHQRAAFKDILPEEIEELVKHGRLLLLLDGWNELDPASRKKLRLELNQVRHDFPHVRLVTTTRRQILDVPTSGPRVAIEPLSEEQELAIARAQKGDAGAKLVDEAWRTTGVRELISTPLYLAALLSTPPGVSPTTKEELLRHFVEQHERSPEHAEALGATLHGCHAEVLTALAARLNAAGSTALTEAEARQIVTLAVKRLRDQGQIASAPEPGAILEALTNHHTLMRSGATGAIEFQHQQLQEWFAGHEVAALMRASAAGDANAQIRLRAAIYDQPAWEESVFFAVERVSREGNGASTAAEAIRLALSVDPMLAAEMIYRATDEVWEMIKSEIKTFVDRWHQLGKVDRAVRFMIITGKAEFASRVWPLASSTDSQIQLPALRGATRFRPSVLGAKLRSRIAALPENVRKNLLALIASESGVDGMDLATELAKADPSPNVQAEVVEHLLFRRADRHIAALLAGAQEGTWALIVRRGYSEEIRDPPTAKRLSEERTKLLAATTEPLDKLRLLIAQSADFPDRDAAIAAAIADPRFAIRDEHAGTSIYYAQKRAPAAVLRGLRQRLEAGLQLPLHAEDFLDQFEVTDEGPIADAILDVSRDRREANAFPIMAGPKTVRALVDKFLAASKAMKNDRNNQTVYEQYSRIRDRIRAARGPSVVAAVLARSETNDPDLISSLSTLISQHGDHDERKAPMAFDPALKMQFIAMLRRWFEAVIISSEGQRYHLAEVANAIGRFGFRELLPELKRLLDEELTRLRKAIAEATAARASGKSASASDATMRYDNQYRDSLARLGGDEVAAVVAGYLEDDLFGFQASLVLKAISDRQLNAPEPSVFRQWPWLDEVAAGRAGRSVIPPPEPTNAYVVPIFAAIDRLAKPENDRHRQLLAIQLTRVALAMPRRNQDELVARVMALPQPLKAKRELAAAIALDGQILDSKLILQAIDDWLDEAKKNEWESKQNIWAIEPWLELLPFTDRPESILDGLTKVKAFYGSQWAQRWERVLRAVAAVPGPQGEVLLAALAKSHKDIANDFEWVRSILGRNSIEASLLYVDLYLDGTLGRGPHGTDAWHAARVLAEYVEKFPPLKAELKKRYEATSTETGRAIFEHLFGEIGAGDDLIAMVKKYAANGRQYDGLMREAVRSVTIRHEPVNEGSNTLYIHPASVGLIRKQLFDMRSGTAQEAALAAPCLVEIDELRDEYGIAANDSRHPDVMSGIPWPTEAGKPG